MKSMGRAWYFLAAIPAVLGIVAAILVLLAMLDTRVESMQRVVVPGTHAVSLDARSYIAFGESESRVGGTEYRGASAVVCTLTGAGGSVIDLAVPTTTTKYSIGGYTGSSLYTFTLADAGTYQLACTGDAAQPTVIALGQGIVKLLVFPFLAFTGGLIGAFVVFLLVRRKRKRVTIRG